MEIYVRQQMASERWLEKLLNGWQQTGSSAYHYEAAIWF